MAAAYLSDLMCWRTFKCLHPTVSQCALHQDLKQVYAQRYDGRCYDLFIITGDRVWALFGFVTLDFAGAHFLALSLAQRREWLCLAPSPSLTVS